MLIRKEPNKLSKAVRLALVCGTIGTATCAAPSFAAETDSEEAESQKIVITGSRIKRTNLVTSSPVTTVGAEEFTVRGITRVEDLLNQLPQVYPGQVSGSANGAVGTATVDLRFLGPQRTLTLVNGRRLPVGSPQAGGAGADINQIPGGLVERVELLTGGSSATYGSDAVAGVVNFIMKDDFEGVEVDYQYSFYQHNNSNDAIQQIVRDSDFPVANGNVNDGDTHNFSIIWGANSPDGKGNVTAYASFRDVEAITQESRDYSSCALDLDDNNNLICAGSGTIPQGRVTNFGGNPANGVPAFDFQVEGDQFVPFNTLYNYGPLNHWQRPDQRRTAGAFAKYEISDTSEAYAEFNFMDDRTNAQIAPSGAFFDTNQIPCGNPFLSAQQFEQLCGQFGLTVNDVQTAYIGRRNIEGGPRNDDLRHTSYRGVIGIRGDLSDNWSYDAFGNYSTVIQNQVYNNDLSITRTIRSLDAVTDANGDIVCRSVVDGSDPNCIPWNVFETGGSTEAARNYLTLPLFSQGETESKQAVVFVTGDLTESGFMVPGTSNGASVVLGLEYRKDKLVFEPDQGFISGDGAGQGGATAPVSGSLDVNEFFGEFSLPLLEDASFAESLTLDLGYRYSDYSTGKTTDTYKIAVDWSVTDDFKIRGSFQSATRHANIRELFVPQSFGLFNADEDPCAGATPTYTQAQCALQGVSADRYGTIADSPAGQYNQLQGGNPDLDPEDSETKSFGVIFSPVEGLDVALDYFNITLEKAIGTISPEVILRKCSLEGNQEFCNLINRSSNQTLWVNPSFLVQTNVNTGSLETEGVDFDVSYTKELGDNGRLNAKLIGTYLTDWTTEPVKGEGFIECLGHWDRTSCNNPTPEWRWNIVTTWTTPWDATLTGTIRYMGEAEELNDGPTDLDAVTYLDVAASWDVMDNTTLRFGINNLFDEEPEIVPNAPSGIGNGNTFPGSYDTLGRYIFAGVTYRL